MGESARGTVLQPGEREGLAKPNPSPKSGARMVSDCSPEMIGGQRPLGEGGTDATIFETNDGTLAVDDVQRALAMWRMRAISTLDGDVLDLRCWRRGAGQWCREDAI